MYLLLLARVSHRPMPGFATGSSPSTSICVHIKWYQWKQMITQKYFLFQVSQLEGVYSVQEPHFWTLCSEVYIGTIKLETAMNADTRYILSQTHNIFTQVSCLSHLSHKWWLFMYFVFYCTVYRYTLYMYNYSCTWVPVL